MLQLGWVHVRVLSTREGQWGLFGGLWVCIIVNHPLTEPPVPTAPGVWEGSTVQGTFYVDSNEVY